MVKEDSRYYNLGHGGGLVDRAAYSGLYDPSSIPLGEKKENKQKRGRDWPIKKENNIGMI